MNYIYYVFFFLFHPLFIRPHAMRNSVNGVLTWALGTYSADQKFPAFKEHKFSPLCSQMPCQLILFSSVQFTSSHRPCFSNIRNYNFLRSKPDSSSGFHPMTFPNQNCLCFSGFTCAYERWHVNNLKSPFFLYSSFFHYFYPPFLLPSVRGINAKQ